MGISISYDRVLDLENQISTSICRRFEERGVVSPTCVRKGVFTVGAINNFDHNSSSATSQSSFHGTGISLFQCPTKDNPSEEKPPITLTEFRTGKCNLPESYTIVPAVALKQTDVVVPSLTNTIESVQNCLEEALAREESWATNAMILLQKEVLAKEDKIA